MSDFPCPRHPDQGQHACPKCRETPAQPAVEITGKGGGRYAPPAFQKVGQVFLPVTLTQPRR